MRMRANSEVFCSKISDHHRFQSDTVDKFTLLFLKAQLECTETRMLVRTTSNFAKSDRPAACSSRCCVNLCSLIDVEDRAAFLVRPRLVQ